MSVHVFGKPGDPDEDKALAPDERLCTNQDSGELVIYHCNCVRLTGSDNVWACKDCGKDSD